MSASGSHRFQLLQNYHPRWFHEHRRACRDIGHDHRVGADFGPVTDRDFPQNDRSRPDVNAISQAGSIFKPFPCHRADRNVLADDAIIPNPGMWMQDDAALMCDSKSASNDGGKWYLNPIVVSYVPPQYSIHPQQARSKDPLASFPCPMADTMNHKRSETWLGPVSIIGDPILMNLRAEVPD